MFFQSLCATALAVAPLLVTANPVLLPVAEISNNLEDRTFFLGWDNWKCNKVQGLWGSWNQYDDLGCHCDTDVSSVFSLNLNFLNGWACDKVNGGLTFKYPKGCQPTCDGNGGYNCPWGYNWDKSCKQPDKCGEHEWWSNNKCCPVGTENNNGVCCPKGCSVKDNQCVPPKPSCKDGSKWCKTTCCPSYQDELDNGKCGCQPGWGDNGHECTPPPPKCNDGWSWCSTMCCRKDMHEEHGTCKCPDGYTDNGHECVKNQPQCDPGSSWCSTKCCRSDMHEDGSHNCVCADGFKDDGKKCSPVPPPPPQCGTGWTYCQTQCCKSYQKEINGLCGCDAGWTDDGSKCNPPPPPPQTCDNNWKWCNTKCCPSYMSETSKGVCGCASGWKDNGKQCVKSCNGWLIWGICIGGW